MSSDANRCNWHALLNENSEEGESGRLFSGISESVESTAMDSVGSVCEDLNRTWDFGALNARLFEWITAAVSLCVMCSAAEQMEYEWIAFICCQIILWANTEVLIQPCSIAAQFRLQHELPWFDLAHYDGRPGLKQRTAWWEWFKCICSESFTEPPHHPLYCYLT